MTTRILIEYNLKDCRECPLCKSERTPGAGYAFDYFCKALDNKKIMGYIELEREVKPVPDWCPRRAATPPVKPPTEVPKQEKKKYKPFCKTCRGAGITDAIPPGYVPLWEPGDRCWDCGGTGYEREVNK